MKEWNASITAFVGNDALEKADAIVLLEGDGTARVEKAAELFRLGFAKTVVISGGATHTPRFTVPARTLSVHLRRKGVPQSSIILDEKSQNTREQALTVIRFARERTWKSILLIASLFHQPRAYLTFIRAMKDMGYRLSVINAPARGLSWFSKTALGRTRLELFQEELKKIRAYQKKGDSASFSEALRYERWKERQR